MKKLLLSISLLFWVTGCSKAIEKPKLEDTIHVATTLYPITYFVERIGGAYVTVTPIIENGADAHTYEPTIQQLQLATDSQLFIFVDPTVESFMNALMPNLENSSTNLVGLGEIVEQSQVGEIGRSIALESGTLSTEISPPRLNEEVEVFNPLQNHIWLYPPYAIIIAKTILHELLLLMPSQEATFFENFSKLESELLILDEAFKELSNAPKPYFMVTHAAYTTWEYYGLHQIPITGILANNELTQKEYNNLIETGHKLNLSYLFYEQNLPQDNGIIIERKLNLKPTKLHNLATITKDDVKNGQDYFTLMYENIHNLKQEFYSK